MLAYTKTPCPPLDRAPTLTLTIASRCASFLPGARIHSGFANLCKFRVSQFFLIQGLLQHAGRIPESELLGECHQRTVDRHFVMFNLIATHDQSSIA